MKRRQPHLKATAPIVTASTKACVSSRITARWISVGLASASPAESCALVVRIGSEQSDTAGHSPCVLFWSSAERCSGDASGFDGRPQKTTESFRLGCARLRKSRTPIYSELPASCQTPCLTCGKVFFQLLRNTNRHKTQTHFLEENRDLLG